jgi:hypothetical protein
MLPDRTTGSRRWSVLQHSRDAGNRCADEAAVIHLANMTATDQFRHLNDLRGKMAAVEATGGLAELRSFFAAERLSSICGTYVNAA